MNWAAISIWLVLTAIFLLVEASTVTMVSLWFAAGSLAALLVCLMHGPIWLQILVFILVSAVLLLLLRPLVRRYVTPKLTATNADAVIGSDGLVSVAIDNIAASGQVKLGGMFWTARSTSGDPIAEGTRVVVDRIEGVKVYVSPMKESVSAQSNP